MRYAVLFIALASAVCAAPAFSANATVSSAALTVSSLNATSSTSKTRKTTSSKRRTITSVTLKTTSTSKKVSTSTSKKSSSTSVVTSKARPISAIADSSSTTVASTATSISAFNGTTVSSSSAPATSTSAKPKKPRPGVISRADMAAQSYQVPAAGNFTFVNVATGQPLVIGGKAGLSWYPGNISQAPDRVWVQPRADPNATNWIRVSRWKFTWCLSAQWYDPANADDKGVLYPCTDSNSSHLPVNERFKQAWHLIPVPGAPKLRDASAYNIVAADHLDDQPPRALGSEVVASGGVNVTSPAPANYTRPNLMRLWNATDLSQAYYMTAA